MEIDLSNGETAESTTEIGLVLLENIKASRDKRGRLIATSFLKLPDKKRFPDYYATTAMPIALNIIEAKLTQRGFPNLTTLESNIRRMVDNAKSYNIRSSDIFADAERIRKMTTDFMKKKNPAYNNKDYHAFPTPLPGEIEENAEDLDAEGDPDEMETDLNTHTGSNNEAAMGADKPVVNSETNGAKHKTPTPLISQEARSIFENCTFQKAQDKILNMMIQLTDERGNLISQPFLNLPPKKLESYYAIIKHPVSLRSLQQQVRGVHGRGAAKGNTPYNSWQVFETATFFLEKIPEAKALVKEPPLPASEPTGARIRLKVSTKTPEPPPKKIMLRVGGAQSTKIANLRHIATAPNVSGGESSSQADTTPRNGHPPSIGKPGSALNGISSLPAHKAAVSPTSSTKPKDPSPQRNRSVSISSTAQSWTAHKSEDVVLPALSVNPISKSRRPSYGSYQTTQNSRPDAFSMPPPIMMPRPLGDMQTPMMHLTPPNNMSLDSKSRLPGRDALITNLSISSHAGLKVPNPFHLDIPPSATATQQSITITLPATHYYLQIRPTFVVDPNRHHRVFATCGIQRLNPMPLPNSPNKFLYEARLLPGVNRIEVEMIAGPVRGAAKSGVSQEVELERISVFANLRKAQIADK
ncbi:MAG: hypothetical protein M1829_005208 [Trizodia sp. TS-e1964]|nr:MAG: hypothetical protein M1829_005208 [Trizodia sp. TS-e1964]